MDDRIERRPPWVPWMVASIVLLVVAMVAYGLGAEHQAAAGETAVVHWHWGLAGIWPMLLFFWIFGAMRWMRWGCGYGYRPWRYRRHFYGDDVESYDEWREWHRREHERMGDTRGPESRPIT